MRYQYDFILSFAGEDRQIVEMVRDILKSHGLEVFYDRDEQHDLLGKDLAEHFSVLYKDKAKYCIIFVSNAYIKKPWCSWERRAALARAIESRSDYLIPYFLENCSISSIPSTVGRADLKDTPPEDFAALLVKKYFKSSSIEDLLPKGALSDILSGALESIAQETSKLPYSDAPIRTGFESIDGKLGYSLKPGGIYIIGSRPSVGKSLFALNIVERNIREGRYAIYLALMESSSQIALRLLSLRSRISFTKLRRGFLRDKDWGTLTDAASSLQNAPLFILDPGYDKSFDKVICELWRLSNGKKPCLIVVDYLQLLWGETFFGEDRNIRSITIMKRLEWLASSTGAVILVLSRFNRNLEDRKEKTPVLSDLYGGKRIAALAQSCFLLHREDLYSFGDSVSKDMQVFVVRRDKRRLAPVNLILHSEELRLSEYWEDDYEYYSNSDPSETDSTIEENEDDIPF